MNNQICRVITGDECSYWNYNIMVVLGGANESEVFKKEKGNFTVSVKGKNVY